MDLVLCAHRPFIIMRNAIRGRVQEQRPVGWLPDGHRRRVEPQLSIIMVQLVLATGNGLM